MARVVITWDRPYHLSDREADAWMLSEVGRLADLPGVDSVALTRARGCQRHVLPCDWVCELHLERGADGEACVGHSVCREWLGDLHLLGMRPAVAILDGTEVVR